MIIPCHCTLCEAHEFDVDTDKLGWPFTSDMFPVGGDCVHSRVWIFPPGPVNMELTCPGCGAFPFEFRDGVPTGRLKIRDDEDRRFVKLVDWREIITGTLESLSEAEFKPLKDKSNEGRRTRQARTGK